ncbi:MAG: hypothetical protein ACRESZ_17920 [Methylococcales bacterium]
MPRDFVRKQIPNVEDFFLSEAIHFNYPIPELEFDLTGHQLSIYTEVWDAKMFRSRHHGNIIVNNTYLSSFAYNIAAVWVHHGDEYEHLKSNKDCKLVQLLAYNLKKFFAEQIMRRSNCVFGSAIFLETLLYEEHLMVPVIKAADDNEKLSALYNYFQNLMSSLLLFHEVGHIVRNKRNDMLKLMQQDIAMEEFGSFWSGYHDKLQIEFECDAFAVLSLIRQRELTSLEMSLKIIAFAFVVFAVMSSIDKSAEATAIQTPSSSEEDLDNVLGDMAGANFSVGIDKLAVVRAQSVQLIVKSVAKQNNIKLFEPHSDFLLYDDMAEVLTQFSLNIITRDNPPYRGKCEMLARALRGNPRGMRYLRLRSKKFSMPNGHSPDS